MNDGTSFSPIKQLFPNISQTHSSGMTLRMTLRADSSLKHVTQSSRRSDPDQDTRTRTNITGSISTRTTSTRTTSISISSSISADGGEGPGRRRRRTREELQEDQERRRAAKEKQREEKERKKEEKRHEQQRRKDAAERLMQLRPENLIKILTVQIHAVLLQHAGCDLLLSSLSGLQWRNCIENQGLPNSISWTRPAPQQTEEDDGNGVIEEDQIVMVVSQNEFKDMVMSHKGTNQSAVTGKVDEGAESLIQLLIKYLSRTAGRVVTILVISPNQRAGFWDEYEEDSALYQQDLDTEELLVYLQLYWNVAVQFLFSWREVTDHVIAVTKALSKRPYRVLCGDPDLGFCVDGSWSGGVRVDREGRGLAQVWTRQVEQLNRVSVSVAKAVTSAYPSPQLLLQAYEELPSEEDQRKLLADLTVVGGATERRVGPELSCRIHRLLTSQNSDLLLD